MPQRCRFKADPGFLLKSRIYGHVRSHEYHELTGMCTYSPLQPSQMKITHQYCARACGSREVSCVSPLCSL
uniref:Uncharacterized protein n=1 Tax=Anguilla anguilla TaxID=7936 RepID=A0A0E9X1G3_ANGAN